MEIRRQEEQQTEVPVRSTIQTIRQAVNWGDFRDELLRHFIDFLDQGEGAVGYQAENIPYARYSLAWVFLKHPEGSAPSHPEEERKKKKEKKTIVHPPDDLEEIELPEDFRQ